MWSIGSERYASHFSHVVYVKEGKIIYAISNRKKTKDADAMLEYIWDNYNMLPFAERWLRAGDLLQFV